MFSQMIGIETHAVEGTNPDIEEAISVYFQTGASITARKTLKNSFGVQEFDSSVDNRLGCFQTEGSLPLLSMFMAHGDESEQIYSIPINHRRVSFSLAQEKVTATVFLSTSQQTGESNTGTDSTLSQFGAGGNPIAVFPYMETDNYEGETDAIVMTTNYCIETGSDNLQLRLANKRAVPLTPQEFQRFLSIFGLARYSSNVNKPVKMCEIAETFTYLKDVDLGSEKGVKSFCDTVGLELKNGEDLSICNLPMVRNKIGKVLRHMTSMRFSMLEGGHRMHVIGMVAKGVVQPDVADLHQVVPDQHDDLFRCVPADSPMYQSTKFEVYQFKKGQDVNFRAQVGILHRESLNKAAHQKGAMDSHIKEEVVLLINEITNPTNPAYTPIEDFDATYWEHDTCDDFTHNRRLLNDVISHMLTSKSQEFPKLRDLLHRSCKENQTVNQAVHELCEKLRDGQLYRFPLARNMTNDFDRDFLVMLHLIKYSMARRIDMHELRRFLNMTMKLRNQRDRPDLLKGKLTNDDRTSYREPTYLSAVIIDPIGTLWDHVKEMWCQVLINHNIMPKTPNGRQNNVEKKGGKHKTAFYCAYQASMIQAWNQYGDDMKTTDKVINFILE